MPQDGQGGHADVADRSAMLSLDRPVSAAGPCVPIGSFTRSNRRRRRAGSMVGMLLVVVAAEGVGRVREVEPNWPLGPHAGTAGTAVTGAGPVDPKVGAKGARGSVL